MTHRISDQSPPLGGPSEVSETERSAQGVTIGRSETPDQPTQDALVDGFDATLGSTAGHQRFTPTGLRAPEPAPSHQGVRFDPAAMLARLRIRPIQTDPAEIDINELLERGESAEIVRFTYPNVAEPSRPTRGRLVSWSEYDNGVTTQHHTVSDPRVMRWLQTVDAGTAHNFENTDVAAMQSLVQGYITDNGADLTTLGIDDVAHLTPSQAAALAGLITLKPFTYNVTGRAFEAYALYHPSMQAGLDRLREIAPEMAARITAQMPERAPPWVREMDQVGSEVFLSNVNGADDGVCRNYTEVFQSVWQALVTLQDPEANQLATTHLKFPMGDYHIWVALYTVTSEGELLVTQLDPTWADGPRVTAQTIRAELERNERTGYSYSTSRALFALQDLHLEVNGKTKAELLDDYYTVWLVSHDLATRGQAKDGARLFMHYLSTLPEVTQKDFMLWLRKGLVEGNGQHAYWSRRGAKALARELQPLLNAATRSDNIS